MKPQDESGDEQPRSPEPHVPDGADISSGFDNILELDRDERAAVLSARLEKLRSRRDELLEKGVNPDQFDQYVKKCEAALEDVKKKNLISDQAQERLIHAIADAADAIRDVVDALEEAVKHAMKERPFDPQVQEWKELLEELREQYPKIEP